MTWCLFAFLRHAGSTVWFCCAVVPCCPLLLPPLSCNVYKAGTIKTGITIIKVQHSEYEIAMEYKKGLQVARQPGAISPPQFFLPSLYSLLTLWLGRRRYLVRNINTEIIFPSFLFLRLLLFLEQQPLPILQSVSESIMCTVILSSSTSM